MKKIILLLTLFTAIIFSAAAASKNKLVKVTGTINQFSNEPFTVTGLVTEDNKQYAVKADKDIEAELLKAAGKKIEIKGYIFLPEDGTLTPELLADGAIEVETWKILEK